MDHMKNRSALVLEIILVTVWWVGKMSVGALVVAAWVCIMVVWIVLTMLTMQRLPRPIGKYF
jgi:hypothetical protein